MFLRISSCEPMRPAKQMRLPDKVHCIRMVERSDQTAKNNWARGRKLQDGYIRNYCQEQVVSPGLVARKNLHVVHGTLYWHLTMKLSDARLRHRQTKLI